MIQVHGTLDGTAYRVVLTGDSQSPVEGSKAVAALVDGAIRDGRTVLASPTGPRVKVVATDQNSLLHLLAAEGRVLSAVGDIAPPMPRAPGVVQ